MRGESDTLTAPISYLQVLVLKQKIATLRDYDVAGMKLIYRGKVLKDEQNLTEAEVKPKTDGGFIVCMVSKAKVSNTGV